MKKLKYYSWVGFLLCLFSNSGFALNTQQEMFKAAEKAARLPDQTVFNTLKSSLRDYPLYPYLLYSNLTKRLADNPVEEIRDFLQTYNDSPLAENLSVKWIEQLAKQQRWQEILQASQAYQREHDSAETQCYYRQALLQTGQQQQALENIEQLWLVGKSQPDACDPLFKHWRDNGGLNQGLIWSRFVLAMEARQAGLGRYLSRLMVGPNKTTANLWLAVHENPQMLVEASRFDPNNPYTNTILLHGIWQLSKRDSLAAARVLDQLKLRYRFNPDEALFRLERRLAILIAKRGHTSATARLAALAPAAVDEEVIQWRVRTALQQQNWRLLLQLTERMPASLQNELTWRYWRARALEATGQADAAQAIYQPLAQIRDYYGFLAADRLGLKYSIQDHPIAVSESALSAIAQLPGMQRARELYALERFSEARAEWQYMSRDFARDRLTAAAKLAQTWNWHRQAIATLAQADLWDDLQLRFPLPYRSTIERYARSQNIDPAWVYAVMRQESLFQPDARSSAGAMGLMQIMPGTGRKIASDLKTRLSSKNALWDVDTNIRYGTYYLRFTLNQLQGNPVLATAAYNAGPQRAQRWLPRRQATDADIWIELIPFDETRKYVKRVMEYSAVYEWKLGRPQSSMRKRMARILPGA